MRYFNNKSTRTNAISPRPGDRDRAANSQLARSFDRFTQHGLRLIRGGKDPVDVAEEHYWQIEEAAPDAAAADVIDAAIMLLHIAAGRDAVAIDTLPARAFDVLAAMGITDTFPGRRLRSLNAGAVGGFAYCDCPDGPQAKVGRSIRDPYGYWQNEPHCKGCGKLLRSVVQRYAAMAAELAGGEHAERTDDDATAPAPDHVSLSEVQKPKEAKGQDALQLPADVDLLPADTAPIGEHENEDEPPTPTPVKEPKLLNIPDYGTEPWELCGRGIKPRSYKNTRIALAKLAKLGITFRHDIFHNRKIVEGDVAENISGQLSDPTCRALRELILDNFGFDPGKEMVQEAAERMCEANRFDPVLDYLDGLHWDGVKRLDKWLYTYLGAEGTALNAAFGRKMLCAMVRRAKNPGCKFDHMPVLEGKQDIGKSTALRILGGDDNFSDQPILQLSDERQQSQIQGVWMYEVAELAGLRRTEVETVKAFITRQSENTRPAYARFREDRPRRAVFAGTTNNNTYLQDRTGNRRFWPIKVGKINLKALRRDRDQLFAEAVVLEAAGENLYLDDPDLRTQAEGLQASRLVFDPWQDIIDNLRGSFVEGEERISSEQVALQLKLSIDRHNPANFKRIADIMLGNGWKGPRKQRYGTGTNASMGFYRSPDPQSYRPPTDWNLVYQDLIPEVQAWFKDRRTFSTDDKEPDWIGWHIARYCKIEAAQERERIDAMIDRLIEDKIVKGVAGRYEEA
jgi:hypothetical protein